MNDLALIKLLCCPTLSNCDATRRLLREGRGGQRPKPRKPLPDLPEPLRLRLGLPNNGKPPYPR